MQSDDRHFTQLPILAVDDEEANLLLLRRVLERAGYSNVATTTDPNEVPDLFTQGEPRLVLLDLHMPHVDGFELMARLGPLTAARRGVPFLVLTADASEVTKLRALSLGASDFLTKPLDHVELLLRVRNLLHAELLQDRVLAHNADLEREVRARTQDLSNARLEVLERLALAAEYRDDATQRHAARIGRTCALIAAELGLPEADVELISRAAPLHDIGKIAIPDRILLKPGRLTAAEFEEVKTHTTIGAEILSASSSPLLRMAERIALSHHERWNGHGYPGGLPGERIPRAGRIVAVADVFDALTHERPYKPAWPVAAAVREIEREAGAQFDPEVVAVFMGLDHDSLALE